jgi:histidine ammonia-lyase
MSAPPLQLTGRDLTPADVEEVALHRRPVALAEAATRRLAESRAVVERALAADQPVYGLTTGLGSRVGHKLAAADLAAFSYRTIRGRAHGVGPELTAAEARAVMLARLNAWLAGGAGISPALATLLAEMLNRDLRPVLYSIGSLGAGDLCLLAHLGLGMIGEGEADLGNQRGPAAALFARAGLAPAVLGPKDGLAIANASSFSAGLAALALAGAARLGATAQVAAALALEAFRGNVTPLSEAAGRARPQPGQRAAAAELRGLLEGSLLLQPGQARRLQDPISLRCVAPVHGGFKAALAFAEAALDPELNGAADNPLILVASDEAISTGNFHTPLLALALDTLGQAAAQLAGLSLARASRLVQHRFSGLPDNLTALGSGASGFAPLMKIGESLLGEIRHLALPVSGEMRWGADGTEDDVTHTPLAAKKLGQLLERLALLLALELLVGAQALELRAPSQVAPKVAAALSAVRRQVAPLAEDRSLSAELRALGAAVQVGTFAALVE